MKKLIKKNVKNNKGITLITLVLTIIVLLILTSISVYSGVDVIRSSKFTKFATELKIMQTHVNEIYQKYIDGGSIDVGGNTYTGDEILNIGKDISQVTDKANIAFTSNGSGITDKTGYKYFDQQTIKDLNIEGVEEEFFINIQKRSIVSCEGFEYENKMYYTLDQIPNGFYNVEYEENTNIPTFDIIVEAIDDSKLKVTVSNIQYNGYIDKWQVNYKIEGQDYWSTSEDLSFIITEKGMYDIYISNGNIVSEIIKKQIEGEETTTSNIKGKYFDKDTLLTIDGQKVFIPAGATVSGKDSECSSLGINSANKDNEGLVIYITNEKKDITDWETAKTQYDQFVWVPVANAIAVDMNGDKVVDGTDITEMVNAGKYPMAIKVNETDYKGILYNFDGTTSLTITPYDYNATSSTSPSYREPDVVSSDSSNGVSLETLKSEFNTMVEKVATNGGFWVGRYETSNMVNTSANDSTNKVTVIKGTTTGIGSVTWYRMYNQQKNYSNLEFTNATTITSSMIWGSQWDQIMIWMKDVRNTAKNSYYIINSLTMGNFGTSDDTTSGLSATGFYSVKNIYDLAGNVFDWTLEADYTNVRVKRRRQLQLYR